MPHTAPPAPACVVLGLFDTGLAAVRALGRAGLAVVGFDPNPREPGFRSRYGTPVLCPSPTEAPESLLALLMDRAWADRPVLYATSDGFVAFVSEYRDALAARFRLALPPRESIAAALDKSVQYRLASEAGLLTPATYLPRTGDDARALSRRLDYPVLVKPAVGHLWRERYRGEKALRIETAPALVDALEGSFEAAQPPLVQELIPGPNQNHCKVCAYFDEAGEAPAVVCMRKLRQYPVDFGVGTLMETVDEPELQALGLRFFRALRWRGPGSIEFKRDARDGRWKLIELNPRLWQQHGLAAACGVSFPMIQYLDLTGRPVAPLNGRLGVRWIDELRDPKSAWEHRRRGLLTAAGWLRSLRGVRTGALWALDDPVPLLALAGRSVWRAGRRLRRD